MSVKVFYRQYFLYDTETERDLPFLLMPSEYNLYTNEYWSERSVADRFYNATGKDPEAVQNIRLIRETVDLN